MKITVVIPVLNEAESITSFMAPLSKFQKKGGEIIIVDGGSEDATVQLAEPYADKIISSEKGRAFQMNAGAKLASGDVLLFLHADVLLPENFEKHLLIALDAHAKDWGRFNVQLDSNKWVFNIIASLMNIRSRISSIATGDQAIFVRKTIFDKVGGYSSIPLMEDIDLCKKLRRLSRPACLTEKVLVSPRRWEVHGVLRSVLLMWYLRAAYFVGVSPVRLVQIYYPQKKA